MSFVTVRSKALSLENQTEKLLTKYSTFAQAASPESSSEEKQTDSRIEALLHERETVINNLQEIADTTDVNGGKLAQLSRHREVLQDNWTNFGKIRSAILQERNRMNLLYNVKSDLQKRKQEEITDEEAYAQDERRRIDDSHSVVDRLITQAWDTREAFAAQRMTLGDVNNKITTTLGRIPGVNQVISKINTRRKKNAVILSGLITCCVLFLFFTW